MAKKKKTLEELLEEAIVPEDDQPYEVPSNWVWVKLLDGGAECLDRFRKPVNATERENRKGDVPYYGATGQVGWIDDYLTDEELVLVGEDGAPFYELLKNKAYIIEGKAWVNNHAHILKSYFGNYGNLYLMHYLNQFNYHGYVNGTTRLKLTQSKMKEIPIPIPTLAEQQRIVNKIECLFSKINKAKELIEEAREGFENRKAAILTKAFRGELTKEWREEHKIVGTGEKLIYKICYEQEENYNKACLEANEVGRKRPKRLDTSYIENEYPDVKIPNNWKWCRIADIIEDLTDYHANGSYKVLKENVELLDEKDYAFMIRATNFEQNNFTTLMKYISKQAYEFLSKSKLFGGEILISKIGNAGTVYYMPNLNHPASLAMNLFALRISSHINSKYIYYHLKTISSKKDIMQYVRGVTTKSIDKKSVRSIFIAIPSREEQDEIVDIIENLLDKENLLDELTQLEDQIELIKKSILLKVFRGELGTNDPTEESALELLKEVLKEKIK
ncbi:restriction endonuclease subunit S [Inediibacterium massiliense]|uniref:restriction endonuclease subunit S n=1 Tax=Inediibacterium massiliense TaxID=1658111 RepID=UPI0006B492BE|nr:restriction endonuclease subunit S [Inediibacterium massiliense]